MDLQLVDLVEFAFFCNKEAAVRVINRVKYSNPSPEIPVSGPGNVMGGTISRARLVTRMALCCTVASPLNTIITESIEPSDERNFTETRSDTVQGRRYLGPQEGQDCASVWMPLRGFTGNRGRRSCSCCYVPGQLQFYPDIAAQGIAISDNVH